jgi:putative CocE/NonD family hydrolase
MNMKIIGTRSSHGRLICQLLFALVMSLAQLIVPNSLATAADTSKEEKSIPAGYQESRVSIPMRDGIHLDTFVLSPVDGRNTYPILLMRTPYGVSSDWSYLEPAFTKAKFIFVSQSVRGRYESGGDFVQMTPHKEKKSSTDVDVSTDTYDTIDWLVKNIPRNNGRVGLRGISYGGFYAAAGMIDAHPALKAVSPQAPQADWFAGDDVHHNGAFLLASSFSFFSMCDRRSDHSRTCAWVPPLATDGYKFFLDMGPLSNANTKYLHDQSPEWDVMMSHGTYDDLWRSRNLLPHLRNIKPAVLAVSGYYDANNLYGAVHVFDAVHRQSPGTADSLVLGPWAHGQWSRDKGEALGALHFGSATSTDFIENIELPFFNAYLKGDGRPNIPVARVFDTGSNQWSSFDSWPPRVSENKTLYLHAQGSLGFEPAKSAASGYDEYVSDPAHPVPFVREHGFDMDPDYMAQDQRFTAGRPDVLIYQTEPLGSDVTIIGPIQPRLVVSSSATDSDWVVKIIDVHPESTDGVYELVRGDVMRAKFRESLAHPVPMQPGKPTGIDFTMLDVYHTFKKGHRIMVQVQSSWFPLVDRNPQQFEDIYSAKAEDFHKATQRVFHSPDQASRIDFRVLPSGRSSQ